MVASSIWRASCRSSARRESTLTRSAPTLALGARRLQGARWLAVVPRQLRERERHLVGPLALVRRSGAVHGRHRVPVGYAGADVAIDVGRVRGERGADSDRRARAGGAIDGVEG